MTFCFDFDFLFIVYYYAATAYIVLLFGKHIYNYPPSFANSYPDNDFYSQIQDLMNDFENQDIKRQIFTCAEKLKFLYPDLNQKALIRASEFLSKGLDSYSLLEQLGLFSTNELQLTPEDLDEDFCRDVVVNHFRSHS